MNVPPDYVPPSDADIEAASRVGGAALVSLRGGLPTVLQAPLSVCSSTMFSLESVK